MVKIKGGGIVFKSIEGTDRQSCAFSDICVLPSGRWLAACRAAPTKAGTKGQHILLSFSDDEGKSWSEIWDTGVSGQPARPVSLPDGRIVMVYVDRFGVPSIKMRISSDGGRTFPAETESTIYRINGSIQKKEEGSIQNAWAEMEKFSIGLPVTLLHNGDILVLFYAGDETDKTDVRWVRVKIEKGR